MSEEAKVTAVEGSEITVREPANEKIVGNMIVEGSITVVGHIKVMSKDGKSSIIATTGPDIAGIWIESSSKKDKHPNSLIAIYDDDGGPSIGFYRDTKEKGLAMTCCLHVDDDGRPRLQIVSQDGKVGSIGLEELLNLIKPEWRMKG